MNGPDLLDISHHQPLNIDYAKVKAAGVQGLWCKATQGVSMVDSSFKDRRLHAKQAGLHFGGYHFAEPDMSSAKVQADHCLSVVGAPDRGHDLRLALDLEMTSRGGHTVDPMKGWSTTRSLEWIDAWLTTVHHAGWQTMLYSYVPYAEAHGFAHHPGFTWKARYAKSPPAVPYLVWQYTNKAVVNGVPPGGLDGDRFAPGVTIDRILTA